MTQTSKRGRCPGHGRHWFTVYSAPGLRSPHCQRCGAANPQPLTDDEQFAYDDHVDVTNKTTKPLA